MFFGIGFANDDPPRFVAKDLFPRARKSRICEECERVIRPGEHYIRHAGADSYARGWSFKMCFQCDADWDVLVRAAEWQHRREVEDGYCYGDLREEIEAAQSDGVFDEFVESEGIFPLENPWDIPERWPLAMAVLDLLERWLPEESTLEEEFDFQQLWLPFETATA
jgi:hypothetical protein